MREVTLLGPRGIRLETAVPQTRRERRLGLLGRRALALDEAMLFEHARSVHTFGMPREIAVALLDARLEVLRVIRVPPRRLVLPRRRTRQILECASRVDLRVGDRVVQAQAGQPPSPAAPVTTHEPA